MILAILKWWSQHPCLIRQRCKGGGQRGERKRRRSFYLGVISDPPDVGDRSHLAGPQNSRQVHFLVLHCHKGSREMDIVQLTYSGTQIHHRVNLMSCDALGQSTRELHNFQKFRGKKKKKCASVCFCVCYVECVSSLLPLWGPWEAICLLFFISGTAEPEATMAALALFVGLAHED